MRLECEVFNLQKGGAMEVVRRFGGPSGTPVDHVKLRVNKEYAV